MPTFKNEVNDPGQPAETAIQGVARGASAVGVFGQGGAVGIRGDGGSWHGVAGISSSTSGGAGVSGEGERTGVMGVGKTWIGVYGETNGNANGPSGVLGEGKSGGIGVKGHASGANVAAVAGYHLTNKGPGIYGEGTPAGFFKGNVVITGDVSIQGISIQVWGQRVQVLQQQVAALQQQVSMLIAQVAALAATKGGVTPPSPARQTPLLSVQATPASGQNTYNVVVGLSGFVGGEHVTLEHRSVKAGGGTGTWTQAVRGDTNTLGQATFTLSVLCPPGNKVEFRGLGNKGSQSALAGFVG